MGRGIAVVAAAVAAALASTAVASGDAGGAGTQTFTQQSRDVLLFAQPNTPDPCNGNLGTLTAIANTEIFHATAQADGTFWVTGTAEGAVTFTPDNPANPSASGHFATWFGESSNNKNDVQHDTSTFVLNGTDGSRIILHMRDHLSTNAQGVVTVTFSISNANVSCG